MVGRHGQRCLSSTQAVHGTPGEDPVVQPPQPTQLFHTHVTVRLSKTRIQLGFHKKCDGVAGNKSQRDVDAETWRIALMSWKFVTCCLYLYIFFVHNEPEPLTTEWNAAKMSAFQACH